MSGPIEPRRSRRELLLRRGLPALVLLLVIGLVVVLGLDDDERSRSSASPPGSTSSPAPAGEEADPEAIPTGSAEPITEAPAPSVVVREGLSESDRTVGVTPADFGGPAEWADGATVRVTDARQQLTSGNGPGALSGQPQTVFVLELTNGSEEPLVLDSVVVQAVYGDGSTQATPLYDDETVDFGGTLGPGETATAVYSFAIPEDQTGDVTLSVDVNGYRFPAAFTGRVPV